MRIRKGPTLLLGFLSALLLVAAAAVFLIIYHEGDIAERNSNDLLKQYNEAVSPSPLLSTKAAMATSMPATVAYVPSASPAVTPEDTGYTQPDAPEVAPAAALVSLPGYDVIGKLAIEKIGVELPVISKTTTKALKVSICWYSGALPGQPGNMVITGHNYANGAHFGRLDELREGDAVTFTAPGGKVYTYQVYALETINPDNAEALDKTSGEYALTLLTCKSAGNRRLVVRCRAAQ